jgi:uncharacterized protein (UPF0332 family)
MDKGRADLAVYRLETARQCIISAKTLAGISDYKGAANRSYYAIFHCMRSVLSLISMDFSKHSAVGAFFRKEYIKTGIFDVRMSDIISEAFDIRSDSDYNDYFVISKREVEEQIANAQYFYDKVEEYVIRQIKEQN